MVVAAVHQSVVGGGGSVGRGGVVFMQTNRAYVDIVLI